MKYENKFIKCIKYIMQLNVDNNIIKNDDIIDNICESLQTKLIITNTEINNEENEIKNKLKHILNISKCDYKAEIIKQPTIKDAHIYCKINQLTGQIYGPLIEYYIKIKYNMIKNNASQCIGDLTIEDKNIEIKVSNGGKCNNKFNYVQIRLNHNCEYLLTAYFIDDANLNNLGELFMFKLNKQDLIQIVLKHGGYAHGTTQKLGVISKESLEETPNNKEYALRPKYGDKCWKELLNFRIDEFIV